MSDIEKTRRNIKDILIELAQVRNIVNYDIYINEEGSKTEGFLSDIYTGEIKNVDNSEIISAVIKMAPKEAGIFTNLADLYKNEINFYSKFSPELERFQRSKQVPKKFDNIPRFYFGNIETERQYIVMENIAANGYRLIDKSTFFNKEHLELLFKVFGKFHALSFAYKDQKSSEYSNLALGFTDVFKNKELHNAMYGILQESTQAGFKAFDTTRDKIIFEKWKRIENVAAILEDVSDYKGTHKCIVHGDCWSNNLLFKLGETGYPKDVNFVDFQMSRESTPVHDLSFCFYSGASHQELQNLELYLQIYYDSFSNFLRLLGSYPEKLYPFQALQQEWQEYGLFGLFLSFDLLVLKLIKPEKALEMRNTEEVDKREGEKMWNDEMARIRETEEYKERSKSVILSAVQHGVL